MGGAKAHYDGIKAFSETDFTEDLKSIDVPTLVMHGDDDQIVPSRTPPCFRQAAQERHAEDLPELPARHVHHARRGRSTRICWPSSAASLVRRGALRRRIRPLRSDQLRGSSRRLAS